MTSLTRRRLLGTAMTTALVSGFSSAPRTLWAGEAPGFTQAQLDSISAAAVDSVNSNDVPGVVTRIWRKGRLELEQAVGLRDVERKLPVEQDTIFAIASMTKPVTVALALTLVDQGRMRLEDPITKWAPEFADMKVLKRPDGPLDDTYPAPRQITIEDLMTHRSGLSYGFTSSGPLAGALMLKLGMGIESTLAPDEWIKALASLPLTYAPGERFNYGHSTDLLGFIVARALKTTVRDAMLERLFGPLKMVDTDFWIAPAKRGRMARTYMSPESGQFMPLDIQSYVGEKPAAYTSPGQGLLSTADDYLTFARMLVHDGEINGRRVLKPTSARLLRTNHLSEQQRAQRFSGASPLAPGLGFGLGVSMIMDRAAYRGGRGDVGSFGWGGAFGGWWQADPAQDMVMLWLVQCLPAPPQPGKPMPTRIPGQRGVGEFQKRTYDALG